jgi:hypothetical protein
MMRWQRRSCSKQYAEAALIDAIGAICGTFVCQKMWKRVSLRGKPPSPARPDTLRRWLRCGLRSGDGWGGRDHHRPGAPASMEY